jgi:hypothetical protein
MWKLDVNQSGVETYCTLACCLAAVIPCTFRCTAFLYGLFWRMTAPGSTLQAYGKGTSVNANG